MLAELCLYFELLIYLAGTLLYRFLTRELLRRPQVLPGNWPLRGVLVCFTLWYGLTLLDELLLMLLGERPDLALPAIAIDLLRAWAWLASFALLVHTLAGVLREPPGDRGGFAHRGWLRFLPYLGYLSLAIFLPATIDFVRAGSPMLAPAVREVFPRVAVYGSVMLTLAGVLTVITSQRVRDRRLAGFLHMLLGVLVLMIALLGLGALRDPWTVDASGFDRVVRTLLMGCLLLPGVLFAYFVQRYNLLRLSLSHRTLRHFVAVLSVVVLVMLAGPALGLEDFALFRRFVAWGLLLALFLGLAYQPLIDRVLLRSTALRRFFGKNMAPHDLDRLMTSLQDPDLDEATVLDRTAAELGRWLGAEAAFLRPGDDDLHAAFWKHYEDSEATLVHRLGPPSTQLAVLLDRRQLHAVFPLRVEGRLEALLALAVSALGGGYDRAELEAVQALIRQLAGTLALRRLITARLAEERRLAARADDERLRMLGLVAASVAHEVKNPLSSMKVLAQALREDLARDEAHADDVGDLDVILEQIDRLHRTTHEILGLARPRAGAATELTALVRSSLYVLKAEAKKRGVELTGDGVEEVGEVPGSEIAWQTVAFNLMLNAVEHSPTGATAEIRLETDGDGVLFTTLNPGDPIDPDAARRLFEPFVSEGGTGLGLALVKRRVEEIGASVDVGHEDGRVIFRVVCPVPSDESDRSDASDGD